MITENDHDPLFLAYSGGDWRWLRFSTAPLCRVLTARRVIASRQAKEAIGLASFSYILGVPAPEEQRRMYRRPSSPSHAKVF
jgi:hypothetical protein